MTSNTHQKLSQGINCKRQVFLKSLVNENLKVDLAIELTNAINNLNNQLHQIAVIIKQEKSKGNDVSKIELEQKKTAVQLKMMQNRLEEVKELKLGELYTTGSVDGYSQLKVGDDLRDKIGSVEVISKNYIIQEIELVTRKDKYKKIT